MSSAAGCNGSESYPLFKKRHVANIIDRLLSLLCPPSTPSHVDQHRGGQPFNPRWKEPKNTLTQEREEQIVADAIHK